jgi:hypothetical protein
MVSISRHIESCGKHCFMGSLVSGVSTVDNLIKAVSEDGSRLVAQQADKGGEVLQFLMGTHADEKPPDSLHPILQRESASPAKFCPQIPNQPHGHPRHHLSLLHAFDVATFPPSCM